MMNGIFIGSLEEHRMFKSRDNKMGWGGGPSEQLILKKGSNGQQSKKIFCFTFHEQPIYQNWKQLKNKYYLLLENYEISPYYLALP